MKVAKYELVDSNWYGCKQVRYLIDIPTHLVHAGDMGGFVKTKDNLAQDGNCVVLQGALVSDNARIVGNAAVSGDARVSEGACVSGNAIVMGNAHISGRVCVTDHAVVTDFASVFNNAIISGSACVFERATVRGCALVYDHARVAGFSVVQDAAKVFGGASVCGQAFVYETASICGNATLEGYTHVSGNAEICGIARVHSACFSGQSSVESYTGYVTCQNLAGCTDITVSRGKDGDQYIVSNQFSGPYKEFVKSATALDNPMLRWFVELARKELLRD